MLAIFRKKTSTYVNENENQNRKLNRPVVWTIRIIFGLNFQETSDFSIGLHPTELAKK